jgi:hypothetical protein
MGLEKGMILHEDANIVVIITWNSNNDKTGDMAQIVILSSVQAPTIAAKNGLDINICGDCPHRPSKLGTCYVNLGFAPSSIYRAYKLGRYSVFSEEVIKYRLKYSKVRFGSYGDPVFIPINIVELIIKSCKGYTGYSHQWTNLKYKDYFKYFMASTDNSGEMQLASNMGYKTYRVGKSGEKPSKYTESICPNTSTGINCSECLLCNAEKNSKNIFINVHGVGYKIVKFNKGK